MKSALVICTVLGIAAVVAGTAAAHEYAPYHHRHGYRPGVVMVAPPVVVARPAPPVVVAPGPGCVYRPYAPVVVPPPAYAPPPRVSFGYYGHGFGITLGF